MTNIGLVREVKGDKALVRFIKESACGGNCTSCGGCGANPIDVWIDNTLFLNPGEKVEVRTDTKKILFSAFVTYVFPLLAFMCFYTVLSTVLNNGLGIFGGVLGFILSFFVVRLYGKSLNVTYEMLRRID